MGTNATLGVLVGSWIAVVAFATGSSTSSASTSSTSAGGGVGTTDFTSGGHGFVEAPKGRMPLLRAKKLFCGADPLGTGPE